MFPPLIKSIYNSFNVVVQRMVDELSKQNETTMKDMNDLRSSVSDKNYIIDNQYARIAKLQTAADKNKSFSRISNLIFGGIAKDVQGSCTTIVYNISLKTK